MPVQSGVYELVNQTNGKRYIGSAVDLRSRKNRHFHDLRHGVHHSSYLQRSYNKHGRDAFVFNVLFYTRPEWCITIEQLMIDELRPEYNECSIAHSRFGLRHSEETKKKMSLARVGGPGTRTGQTVSLETKEIMSRSALARKNGYKHREETKEKMRIRAKTRDHTILINNYKKWWYSLSDEKRKEHGEKISNALRTK